MAKVIQLKHSATGLTKDGFYGFSWTTFFFGPFVPLFRGDFLTFLGYFAIVLIISIATAGIGGFFCSIIWSFFYNNYYTKKLIEKGYKFSGTEDENKLAGIALGLIVDDIKQPQSKNDAINIQLESAEKDIKNFYNEERSLEDEKYKLYLVSKFDIQKNDVLERYIVRDEIFRNLDDALIFCKNIDDNDYEGAVESHKKLTELAEKLPDYGSKTGSIGPGSMYKFVEYRTGRVEVSHASGFYKEFSSMTEAEDYFKS